MRIVSWNINSVRLRLNLLAKLQENSMPDIICLQETKVDNDNFPEKQIHKLGFEHIYFDGEKSYNGVAILSKKPLYNIHIEKFCGKQDCRHISAEIANNIVLHNFYVPAGGDEPDVEVNPKFKHKLQFMDEMQNFLQGQKNKDLIVVGDINIAPLENDVWSHKQLLKVVSHTPVEIEKFEKLQESMNLIDCHRQFCENHEKLYSWWSYRNRDWRKSNRGRRLDHILITPELQKNLKQAHILKNARDWDKPSDHVPIIGDFIL